MGVEDEEGVARTTFESGHYFYLSSPETVSIASQKTCYTTKSLWEKYI